MKENLILEKGRTEPGPQRELQKRGKRISGSAPDRRGYAVRVAVAVHTFRQADKPYIQPDKKIFNQVSGIGIVTGEAGQVFDNHAVDPAAIHIGQKPLEIFTVGIRPGFAVIRRCQARNKNKL